MDCVMSQCREVAYCETERKEVNKPVAIKQWLLVDQVTLGVPKKKKKDPH